MPFQGLLVLSVAIIALMRRGNGFTLIELLVVISIISLLIGVMVPVLANVIDAGRTTVCASNLHQQGLAWESAMADEQGLIPRTSGLNGWVHGQDRWWFDLLAEYMTPGKLDSSNSKAEEEQIICPQLKQDSGGDWVGRNYNAYAVNVRWIPGSESGDNELQSWYKVRTPALYPWIGDPVYQQHHSGSWQTRRRLGHSDVWPSFVGPDRDMPGWGLGFNHANAGYAVFADAHVSSVDESDFEQVNSDGVPDWFFNR